MLDIQLPFQSHNPIQITDCYLILLLSDMVHEHEQQYCYVARQLCNDQNLTPDHLTANLMSTQS